MITTSVPRVEMRVAAIQRPSGLIAGCTSPFSPMRVVLFLAMLYRMIRDDDDPSESPFWT
jgi:hypothetical protein